jgi:GNAT superfamily N-acetyltransferase
LKKQGGKLKPYTIRIAIELDMMQLIEIAKEYIEEADRWSGHEYNEKKVIDYCIHAITNKSHNIFLAVDSESGRILGFFWGCITGQVWSDDPIGQEMFMYVRKEARGNEVGRKLVSAFIKWCKVSGCKSVHCGAHSGIDNDKPASSMYRSLGFKLGGYNFNMKL